LRATAGASSAPIYERRKGIASCSAASGHFAVAIVDELETPKQVGRSFTVAC